MEAVKRSARLALELVTPTRALAPLKALELPRNLVRQGLEKVRDLGLKIGHAAGKHFGQDFTLLTQVSAAVLRPIKAVLQRLGKHADPLELSLEKTLLPRQGPRIGR
jgi:hypothetical protein